MRLLFISGAKSFVQGALLTIFVAVVVKIVGAAIERFGTNYVVWWIAGIMLTLILFFEVTVYILGVRTVSKLAKKLDLPKDFIAEGLFVHGISYNEAYFEMNREDFIVVVNIRRVAKSTGAAIFRVRKNNKTGGKDDSKKDS